MEGGVAESEYSDRGGWVLVGRLWVDSGGYGDGLCIHRSFFLPFFLECLQQKQALPRTATLPCAVRLIRLIHSSCILLQPKYKTMRYDL